MAVLYMHIACWVPKSTNSHSRVSNTYWFSTATVVARMLFSVTLYMNWLSCFKHALMHTSRSCTCNGMTLNAAYIFLFLRVTQIFNASISVLGQVFEVLISYKERERERERESVRARALACVCMHTSI